MSTADQNSRIGESFDPDTAAHGGETDQSARASIWLDGDVLACACPDCAAPMSIRLWLLVADCWRCGTSIELTAEQEREAKQLLQQREAARGQPTAPVDRTKETPAQQTAQSFAPAVAPSVQQPKTKAPTAKQPDRQVRRPRKPTPQPQAPVGPTAAAANPGEVRRRLQSISTLGEARVWLRDWLRALPAWLTSLLVHMLLIILLGLWLIQQVPEEPRITLATTIGEEDIAGAELAEDEPIDAFEFEDPGDLEAEELPTDDPFELESPDLFDADNVLPTIGDDELLAEAVNLPALGPIEPGNIFAGRDPRLRKQLLEREGGTDYTEAAVARGLKWLARHQHEEGNWSLHNFHNAGDCDGRCDGRGGNCDHAATALALLPFLGAGQTHRGGEYAETVRRGLYWLTDNQRIDGDLRGRGIGRMYAHGQCAIVLCEAYALSRDEELREPAQMAIDFIVAAQHSGGGWRYSPRQPGDTSVVGWQLMALRSARMAYLKVPERTLERAAKFLDSVQTDSRGGRYGYMRGHSTSETMTAEALLCRQYDDWQRDHAGMRTGVRFLVTQHLPRRGAPNIYFWYYATQVMHHYGGAEWETWNYALRDILVETQNTRGHEAGSWDLRDPWVSSGGRLYVTSLAICTLEVYYRHLPLYRAEAIDD